MKELRVRPSNVIEAFERELNKKLEREALKQGRRDLLRKDSTGRLEKGPLIRQRS
jgi:hypothetical protein